MITDARRKSGFFVPSLLVTCHIFPVTAFLCRLQPAWL
nr:MAG TPA: hypothetical protein [Herelleviridae sp.]